MGPDWEDLSVFIDPGAFGVAARSFYRSHPTAGEGTVSVIFDQAWLNPELGEYEAETYAPRLSGRAVDLAFVERGDAVVIGGEIVGGELVGGERFDVLTSAQPDGTGWATVTLAPPAVDAPV